MRLPILASLLLTVPLYAGTRIFETFEGDGFNSWQVEGKAFGLAPVAGKTDEMKDPFTGYSNDSLVTSAHGGEASTGTLTSPEFKIEEPFIAFLIAGGNQPGKTAAQLVINGEVVREATGKKSLLCGPVVWDVGALKGSNAKIRLVDDDTGPWGVIGVDQVYFTDYANPKFPVPTREGKAFVSGLVPTHVVAGANIPVDGVLKIEATHAAQEVTSPTALTFDDEGRVILSETHRFRHGIEDDRDRLYWYLDDLASKTTADRRALHEKWKAKVPLNYLTEKSELIRRLADTDGDGNIDESKVFADGFSDVLDGTAAGVFYYDGFLYFACIPKIYMLRDSKGDGVADERKVVADGFGVRISLSGHDLNGFTLGPDGRIYGTVGDRGLSLVTSEGVTYDYRNEGAAFRFEPDGSNFEIFHTGLRNPKEIAFDALGNPFTVDNNSDQGDQARVVYLVDGGDTGWQMEHQAMHTFHRQIGLTEHPPSRWMDEKMWELENPSQPAYILPPCAYLTSGPSGLTYHPGTGFLESEAGRFLICDYRGGAANSGIWSFAMSPKGAGMELSDSRQFAWGIAATDVEYSWDGKIYISDFITGWASHDDGRLLSLSAGSKTFNGAEIASTVKIVREGFNQRSSAELANLMKHPDARIRLRAQIALTRKDDAVKRFSDAALSTNFLTRIHAIWGLGIVARRGSVPQAGVEFGKIPDAGRRSEAEMALISFLGDKDPEIRAQALRALGDAPNESKVVPLGPLLTDPAPRVRFFAALLAGKHKQIAYYGPICDLLQENDNRDVYLRHAGIFALQHMATTPSVIAALATHNSPAVRLAAAVALRRMKSSDISVFIHDADTKVADEAIRAICDNDMVAARPQVAKLLDNATAREWAPFMMRRLIHNSFRLGTAEDAARVLKVAADAGQPEIVRREALRLMLEWTKPFPADQLTGHWRPLAKRDAATIQPVLSAALPGLLKQGGYILTGALQLTDRYQLTVPGLGTAELEAMVGNTTLPTAARTDALGILLQRNPEKASQLLVGLTSDASDEVAIAALAAMAKISPATVLPHLEKALASNNPARTRKIWEILATLPGETVDAVFVRELDKLRASNGVSASALELLSAARSRKSGAVTAAVAALEKFLTDNSDPLAKWNPALEGGDAVAGAALFRSNPAGECMRCHRAEEGHAAGGETAPNLAGIGNRHKDHRYFLESMILPSSVIAPGFGTVVIDFKNGASLSGNLIAENTDSIDIDVAGKASRIRRSDIESFTPPVSPMPPMGGLLEPGEVRDLIAWLASLDRGGEVPTLIAEPTPLDPATLEPTAGSEASGGVAKVDPATLKLGRQQFMVCGACHGQSGEGTAAGPPLAGSEWVNGPEENLIRIQLRGLQGPIRVKGQEYTYPVGMAALAYQTDEQIAAVLTYIRNSFGNEAPPVSASSVTALRTEVGKPQLFSTDLIKPQPFKPAPPKMAEVTPANTTTTENLTEAAATGSVQTKASPPPGSPYNKWIVIGVAIFVIGAFAQAMRLRRK